MKKFFKVFLCIALVVTIGVGAFFLFKKNSVPSADEMYIILNADASKIANNEVVALAVENQKLSYELPLKGEEVLEERRSFAGVTDEDKVNIVPYDVEKWFSSTKGQLDKTYIGYNTISGEGYLENNSKESVIGWCSDSASVLEKIGVIEESNVLNAEYIVQNNDKLINYVRPENAVIGTDTYGEYVGVDCVSKINGEFVENNDLVNFLKDTATLESFNNNVFTLYSILVDDDCDYDITLNKNKCTINNNIAKEGKNYALNCSITSDEIFEITIEEEDYTSDHTLWFSVNCDMNVVFNDSHLLSCSYKLTFNERLNSPIHVLYNSDGKSVFSTTMMFWSDRIVENSFNFSYELNGEKVNAENYSTFDDEITYKKVTINYYGINNNRENTTLLASDKLECTRDFTARHYLDEEFMSKWYLDKECTIPFSAEQISKVPSKDLNLYSVAVNSNYIIFVLSYIDKDTLVETSKQTYGLEQDVWSFNNVENWVEHFKPTGVTIVSYSPTSLEMYAGEIYVVVVMCDVAEE